MIILPSFCLSYILPTYTKIYGNKNTLLLTTIFGSLFQKLSMYLNQRRHYGKSFDIESAVSKISNVSCFVFLKILGMQTNPNTLRLFSLQIVVYLYFTVIFKVFYFTSYALFIVKI